MRIEPKILGNIEKAWGIKRLILDMLDLNCLCSPGGYLLIGGGVDGFQGEKSNLIWKSKFDHF